MHFVVFSGGTFENGIAVNKTLARFDKVIAVDSGARHCKLLSLVPDFVIGDFDSIDKKELREFEKKGAQIIPFSNIKDVTDTELAIDLAQEKGATKISILGGITGDRIDHILGNILLLLKRKFAKIQIQFANGNQQISLARNQIKIKGKIGDTVSFIPITGTVNNLTSTGLRYDLAKYQLSIQGNHGISNELTSNTAKIIFPRKTLLVIHTLNN